MGVVVRWLVGVVVRRYIDIFIIITFPYSTCITVDREIFVSTSVTKFKNSKKIINIIIGAPNNGHVRKRIITAIAQCTF